MKSFFVLALILFIAFFSAACPTGSVETVSSNAVVAAEIYQSYEVTANRRETSAFAIFRIGGSTGTTIDLTAPGKIQYNGVEMSKSAPVSAKIPMFSKGTTYYATAGTYRPTHEFIYTDRDGKVYKNTIELAPLELTIKTSLAPSATAPTAIPLSRAVLNDEKIAVSFDGTIFDDAATTENAVYLDASRQTLFIAPAYWKKAEAKKSSELTIKVTKSEALKDATSRGGNISVSYESASVSFNPGVIPPHNSNSANQPAATNTNKSAVNMVHTNSANQQNANLANKSTTPANANISKPPSTPTANANTSANSAHAESPVPLPPGKMK